MLKAWKEQEAVTIGLEAELVSESLWHCGGGAIRNNREDQTWNCAVRKLPLNSYWSEQQNSLVRHPVALPRTIIFLPKSMRCWECLGH
jgi:hypothetical protein